MDNGIKEAVKKLTDEMAIDQLQEWIVAKCGQKKFDQTEESSLNILCDAMQDGLLILKNDGTATYKLRMPVDGDQDGTKVKVLTELNFKAGLKYKTIKHLLKKIDATDNMGMALAYTAGLTGTPMPILEEMEMWDLTRVQLLMVFFVV